MFTWIVNDSDWSKDCQRDFSYDRRKAEKKLSDRSNKLGDNRSS